MSGINNRKISEAVNVQAGALAADGSGGITTGYADMTLARQLLAHGQVSLGNVTSIQLREAQDDQGTGAQDLGSAVTVGAAEGIVEVDAADLSDGYTHVAAVVTADGANPTAATLVTGMSRFNG